MSYADYAKMEGTNWSLLKELDESPMHYHHRLHNPRPDSDTFLLGRAVHTAVLEPDEFAGRYTVFDGIRRESYRGKGKEFAQYEEWQAVKNGGAEILTPGMRGLALCIAEAVTFHPRAAQILADGESEIDLQWTDEETEIKCKGRADWATPGGLLVDLKTTGKPLSGFERAIANYSYHGQLAYYHDGLRAMTGESRVVKIIVVEKSAPYDVGVFELDPWTLSIGRLMYRDLLVKLARCNESGIWPGRYPESHVVTLPEWAIPDEEITF